jgi:FAD/FMN-containing dehydrogenase
MGAAAMQLVRPRLPADAACLPSELWEPGAHCALLLLETDSPSQNEALAQLEAAEAILRSQGAQCSGAMADSGLRGQLWRVRSELSPACFDLGGLKLAEDVCVPRSRTADFIRGLEEIAAAEGLDWVNYGHIGDGNFHCTLMFADAADPRLPAGQRCIEAAYRLALGLGGSISGEHGIGLLKKDYLALQIGETEIEIMRGIKRVFDPKGILNPGKWL